MRRIAVATAVTSLVFAFLLLVVLAWTDIANVRAAARGLVPPGNAGNAGQPATGSELPAYAGLIALTLRDAAGRLQIFTINVDGTNKKQLTFDGDNGRPDWSPDGKQIVFSSMRNGGTWVAVMDADGSNQALLVEGFAPDWSPDGAQIAFSRPVPTGLEIWVINASGSGERQVTNSGTFKVGPSWSPDGTEMAFILVKNPGSQSDPQPEIGIMNADGTNEGILTTEDRVNIRTNPDGSTTLCETAYDANAPAWSPLDNRITFWSGIENQYGQIWVINADGTGSKQLTEDCTHRNSDDPSWSPDASKILFSTGRSGRNELWVMDADGENEQKVSDIDAAPFPGRASWQPVPPPSVGGIAELPEGTDRPLVSDGSSGPNAPLLLGLTAGAVGLCGAAWWLRRRAASR